MCIALVVLISSEYADGFSLRPFAPSKLSKKPEPISSADGHHLPSVLSLARVPQDDDDYSDDENREYVRVPRGGRRRKYSVDEDQNMETDGSSSTSRRRVDDDIMGAVDRLEASGILDDYDDEEFDMFSNEVIPNQILDSIDPDGAAERFPELARDPKFWFEIGLFVTFINFVSFIGPR